MDINKEKDIGIIDIISIIKKYKQFNVVIIIASLIFSIFYSFTSIRLYKSYISIYPSSSESNISRSFNNLQGLATTFGIDIGGGINNEYYIPDIINSRQLKKAIIINNWNTNLYSSKVNLIKYWELKKISMINMILSIFKDFKMKSDEYYLNIAIDSFSNRLSIRTLDSGLIIVSVLMEEEKMASDIVNFIADWITNYIANDMNVQATKNRQFIENQVENAKIDLFNSEEKLTEFQKNHSFADDNPEIHLKRGRLMRNIEVNQQVYITLKQQYELNKLEELKERPVLNILDIGEPATIPSKPKKTVIILISLISTITLSIIGTFIYESIKKNKKQILINE